MATKSQFTVNNYFQKFCFWQRTDRDTLRAHLLLLTSELFVKQMFKITVLLDIDIILLSFDNCSAEEMASLTLSNVFFLISL